MVRKPRPIDAALLAGLGRIVVHWSLVVTRLDQILAWLQGMRPGAIYVFTEGTGGAERLAWLRAAFAQRPLAEDRRLAVEELLDTVEGLRAERDSLVNGVWNGGGPAATAEIQTVRREGPGRIATRLITLAELEDLDGRLQAVLAELADLLAGLKASG